MQTFVEYQKRDLLIGVFVILSLLVILTTIFVKLRWSATGYYSVTAEFSRISSIDEGTKVRLRGYDVGYVSDVEFYPIPTKPDVFFHVELAVGSDYPLLQGTRAKIQGGGLVGDRFIELIVPEGGQGRVKPGDFISGEVPDDLGETLRATQDMMRKVGRMARRIDDADIGGKFSLFVAHVRRIQEGVDRLSQAGSRAFDSIDMTVTDLRPEMKKSMVDLNRNLEMAETILISADTILVENREQILQTLSALNTSLTHMQSLMTSVDSIATGSRDDIAVSLKNLQEASVSLKDLAKHPWKFFSGKVE